MYIQVGINMKRQFTKPAHAQNCFMYDLCDDLCITLTLYYIYIYHSCISSCHGQFFKQNPRLATSSVTSLDRWAKPPATFGDGVIRPGRAAGHGPAKSTAGRNNMTQHDVVSKTTTGFEK